MTYDRKSLAERLKLQVKNTTGIIEDLENPDTPEERVAAIIDCFNESRLVIEVAKDLRDKRRSGPVQ